MNYKFGAIIGVSIFVILLIIGYALYQDPESRFFIGQLIGVIEQPSTSEDTIFEIEAVVTGIPGPTTMAFLDDDIIYLEKNTGKVRLIQNGKLKDQALLDFNVNDRFEGGMLGVVVKESFVYFYLTEAEEDGGEPLADRVYKFFWDGQKLVDSKLIHSFNVSSLGHHGGAMTVGADGTVYLVRGDQRAGDISNKNWGILQNYDSFGPDDTSVIIILEKDDSVITPSKSENPLEHYYAMGIRNSFGITFDPITNNMWISENGPENYDEINLVPPKYNSGWSKIMGPANQSQIESLTLLDEFTYSDPEFSWEIENIAPTALEFVNDPRWPQEYENSLFVGICQRDGIIFDFKLNPNRDGFIFESTNLKDKVVNHGDSMEEIILFSDFTCVTDLEFGPDGSLYVVSYKNNGAIYKITPMISK